MKKISLALNFLLAMLLSCSVFAAQHYSASLGSVSTNKIMGMNYTRVEVLNNSKNSIYAVVPESNGEVNLEIPAGKRGIISHGGLFKSWIGLVLEDSNHMRFFGGTFFDKYNTLTVSGETGSHSVKYSDNRVG